MKQLVKNYSFDKTAKTVTFTDFSTVLQERVLLITDVTAGIIIYQFNDASLGGTASGNVLTLTYNTSALANTDKLQIFYDSTSGDPTYDATPTVAAQGTVASGAADSGNPVKVGGRYNASTPTLSDGQRADLQLDASGNTKVYLATKLDNTNDSVTNYPFGHLYQNITTATTTTVKSGAGVLHRLVVNTPVASGTITLYDNTSGSGTKIGTVTLPSTLLNNGPMVAQYECAFVTGLTIVTTGTCDITVTYR